MKLFSKTASKKISEPTSTLEWTTISSKRKWFSIDLRELWHYRATCDQEVMEYAKKIGAPAIPTKDTHERASNRTAEALLKKEQHYGAPKPS